MADSKTAEKTVKVRNPGIRPIYLRYAERTPVKGMDGKETVISGSASILLPPHPEPDGYLEVPERVLRDMASHPDGAVIVAGLQILR